MAIANNTSFNNKINTKDFNFDFDFKKYTTKFELAQNIVKKIDFNKEKQVLI